MNRDNDSKIMLDRMEHDWGMNWYGGGTKSCRYLGESFVLFSCIDWRQVEHRPDGIIINDYSKMQYLSGIVPLEAWKQWFPMWIEKRGSNPDEMFTVLKSVVVDRIYEARTLSRSRAAATAAFRSLEPQDVLNLQIKKNI